MKDSDPKLMAQAETGIRAYLESERAAGRIAGSYYEDAVTRTVPNLRKWLLAEELDRISPNLREGLRAAIREQRWVELTNAFSRDVAFGTGGIREKMGFNRDAVLRLKVEGIHAPIIKGPNTINDVVLLLTSAGVAQFGLKRRPRLETVVIGYDSRIRGADFARIIAELFLAYDYTVYLFDEACMYPSVTYAVPRLAADIGVFISASHNDFRYNGYKLSCQNGSQFDPAERKELYENFITKVRFTDIKRLPLEQAPPDKLWFLGGVQPADKRTRAELVSPLPLRERGEGEGASRPGSLPAGSSSKEGVLPLADPLPSAKDLYAGRTDRIIDLHTLHIDHVKTFLLRPQMIQSAKRPLSIGYSAFNGSGRKAVPRLLGEIGFKDVKRVMKLDPLDGMFPAFRSDPGHEQQPDPGDWRAADIAVSAFQQEYPSAWESVDLIIGTDPDADRCGVIIKVPPHQREAYRHPGTGEPRDYSLLSADEAWTLIVWYRLMHEVEQFGRVRDAESKFIVLSHTTTDLLVRLARKYGCGVLRTWVGFAQLAAGTRAVWDLHRGIDTPGITDSGRLPPYDEGHVTRATGLGPRDVQVIERAAGLGPRGGDRASSAPPPLPRGDQGGSRPAAQQAMEFCNRTIHSWEAMDGRARSFNIAALEQSNGFTLLGGPPPDDRSLGLHGHVRDKDGTFAAVLMAELAQYAKEQNTHLLDLLDEKIYLDPDIGLYITHYEPDPMDGEYEGLAGYTRKRALLQSAEDLFANWREQPFNLGGMPVKGAVAYRTGKYDGVNWPGFPDEGFRFYLDEQRRSHLTIRPSGTSNALRFHVQLFGGHPPRERLIGEKARLRATAAAMVSDIRTRIGCAARPAASPPHA